jgi:hypothetical protein
MGRKPKFRIMPKPNGLLKHKEETNSEFRVVEDMIVGDDL